MVQYIVPIVPILLVIECDYDGASLVRNRRAARLLAEYRTMAY